MLSKLTAVADKYRELEALLSDPAVMADMARWQRYTREHAALTPIVIAYEAYRKAETTVAEDKEMLAEADAEMKELLLEEIAAAEAERERLAKELPILLLPRDPNDDKNVIVEIRGGVGGEEAALFAASIPTALRARAGSTSTVRRLPSASRICRRASSCSVRMKSRSSRIRKRR